MQTIDKQPLTPEQRQANVDRLLARWKESRAELDKKLEDYVKTPEFQEMKKRLRAKNEKSGIVYV